MDKVLPIIVVCSVGIALCLAYIVYMCFKMLRAKLPKRPPRELEIEDDVLTIQLKRGKKSQK